MNAIMVIIVTQRKKYAQYELTRWSQDLMGEQTLLLFCSSVFGRCPTTPQAAGPIHQGAAYQSLHCLMVIFYRGRDHKTVTVWRQDGWQYQSRDAAHATAESKRAKKHREKVSERRQCSDSIKAVFVTFVILDRTATHSRSGGHNSGFLIVLINGRWWEQLNKTLSAMF